MNPRVELYSIAFSLQYFCKVPCFDLEAVISATVHLLPDLTILEVK